MILLITQRNDLTADFLISRMIERGVGYLRFDVDCYLQDVTLSASFDAHGVCGEISTPQGVAELAAIRAVWYRRAMSPRLESLDLSVTDRVFAQRESRHFLEGVLGALPARWVNHWVAVHMWERKLAQVTLFEQNFGDFRGYSRRKSWIGKAAFAKTRCSEDLPT